MKQIIVNVGDLTIEEKQRVNEVLAKTKNIRMCDPPRWDKVITMYGPSFDGVNVGFDYHKRAKPTHTPQQVLEMAGMSPSAVQHVFLADTLIITDSSGNIVYDSTLDVANPGKGGALPDIGDSVKLDENGVAVMVEKRKVRKDFNPAKEYNVNVKECTEEEKKEVQQAFFDAGFIWKGKGAKYGHPSALQYTNKYDYGDVSTRYLYEGSAEGCNMTSKEFLDLVYEPKQQGHVHAELMAQYAEDAKTHVEPWKLWEIYHPKGGWRGIGCNPTWASGLKYRRKPKTHIVHGVEIPELRVSPELGDEYYLADPTTSELTELHTFVMKTEKLRADRGLCYQNTEEGKQAAILHSKAMLGSV